MALLPELLTVEPAVRRVVGARVRDRHLVEDLVQETLARVLEAHPRLEERALLPYAVVTARNLVVSHARDADTARRHRHRLVDLDAPDGPDEELLRREEAEAVGAALARLETGERAAFVAHTISGATTAQLAEDSGSTPGGVAVALARTRAKLRVDYVLALRRAQLPTDRCRPVLVALSAGDTRRQRALDAGGHLLECPACHGLSAPLLQRRRGMALLAPLAALPRGAREHPAAAALLAVLAALAAVGALAVFAGSEQPVRATAPPAPRTAEAVEAVDRRLTVDGAPLAHPWGEGLTAAVGRTVRGRDLPVTAVVADEGFWVSAGADRVYVRIVGGGESAVRVREGDLVGVEGAVTAHGPGFAENQGVSAEEGAAELDAQGMHLEIAADRLTAR